MLVIRTWCAVLAMAAVWGAGGGADMSVAEVCRSQLQPGQYPLCVYLPGLLGVILDLRSLYWRDGY